MAQSFTVHDLPLNERPRERLMKHGADAISAQELIAVVLGRGVSGQSVMAIAQKLLVSFGSLEGVVNASFEQLQSIRGLGPAKAAQLKACLEIVRRVAAEEIKIETDRNAVKPVASPNDVAQLVWPKVRDYQKEHLFVISFDNRNRVLGIDLISVGTLNASLVHPRETFNAAMARNAASIIVCHNHPSGDPHPSEADLTVTKRLVEAGVIMGVQLLDHVIICKTAAFSFKENNLL